MTYGINSPFSLTLDHGENMHLFHGYIPENKIGSTTSLRDYEARRMVMDGYSKLPEESLQGFYPVYDRLTIVDAHD